MKDPQLKEYMRLKRIAKRITEDQIPGFNFDAYMKQTIQGESRGCLYPTEYDYDERLEGEVQTTKYKPFPRNKISDWFKLSVGFNMGMQVRTILSNQPLRPALRSSNYR